MFSDTLKEETQQNHVDLEKKIVPRIKAIQSEQDYITLLKLFYSYFGALETLVQSVLNTSLLPDSTSRRKSEAILNDICALGGDTPNLAGVADLPEISDHAAALGAMYVMEGSTLGGQIISKMIAKALPGKTDDALSFYKGYGENTMPMWIAFKNAMNEHAVTADIQKKVINAANETFLKFSQWVDKAG